MRARRLPLASVFVFCFCLTTGCGLSPGTPARSFQHTITTDQTRLAQNGLKQANGSSEQANANALSLKFVPVASATLDEPSVLSYDNVSRKEAATPENDEHPTKDRKQNPASNFEIQSSVAFQLMPQSQADDRWPDLFDHELENWFELPLQRRRLEFSKAVVEHYRVRYFIGYFSKNQKEHFATALIRSGRYFPMIARLLQEAGLPEELGYIALIESSFLPHALSASGAAGLWQFVPQTARKYGLRINSYVDERRDPEKSTRAAAAYLKELHEHFGKWYLATAAYNAGQGAIKKAMKTSGAKDFWNLSDKAMLKDETRDFVPKFVAAAVIAANPQKYGFDLIDYDSPLDYEEVEVGGNRQLASLAGIAGIEAQTIRELNPELLQSTTPPGENGFRVKLPVGYSAIAGVLRSEEKQPERHMPRETLLVHEVRRGETLLSIARRYGQEVRMLMELNGLQSSTLRVGQKLRVLLQSLRGTLR